MKNRLNLTPASPKTGHSYRNINVRGIVLVALALAAMAPSALEAAEPAPALRKPKHTIAVSRFTAHQAFMNQYGNWDVGGGLSAMLTTALEESQKFIVVERENLTEVLSEQNLAAKGLIRSESAAKAGNLLGAQLLIMGSVTSFDEQEKGGGLNIGISGLKNIPVVGGLAPKFTSGSVGIDFKIIDSTSGEVLETHAVKEKVKKAGIAADVGYGGISFGGSQFKKTPLGEAMRNAIQEAVRRIETRASKVKWAGQVIDADEESVFLNAGSNAGMAVGSNFVVLRKAKELRDPSTGQLLGVRKNKLGQLTIKEVFENYSVGTFAGDQPGASAKGGDLVEAL